VNSVRPERARHDAEHPRFASLEGWRSYLLAVVATFATLALRVAFDDAFHGYPGLIVFTAPILLSAYLGGLRAGLTATALAFFVSQYLLWLPLQPLIVEAAAHRWLQFFLVVAGVSLSVLSEALHRARLRTRESTLRQEGAQAELESEKARLVAAQAVSRVGSWETDPSTGAVSWSEETRRIFESSSGEAPRTHQEFLARVHPEDRARVAEAFDRSLASAGSFSIEHRLLMADGRVKHVEERWRTSFDAGKAAPVLGTCQDVTERTVAAAALEALTRETGERERMLSSMLSSIRDFTFLFDRDGRFLYANRSLLDMWGLGMDEVTGRTFHDLGYPDELALRLRSQLMQVLHTRRNLTEETRYTTPSGEVRCYEYIFSPVIGGDGDVDFVVGSSRDITERKVAEEELRRQHSLLANAQRVGGMGVWELDLRSNRVTWSEETYRIFGVAPEDFGHTSDAFYALVRPEDVERLKALQSSPGAHAVEAEYRIRRPDGEERVLYQRGELSLDDDGTPLRKVGVVRDVTDMKRAESALVEAERKYRSLFENSIDGIFQNTPDGRMLVANPAMARMMGYASPEEFVRARTDVLRETYARPELREEFRRVIEEKGFIDGFEYEVLRKDGTPMWVSENVHVVRDAAGNALRYEGSMRDISERRRSEAVLRKIHNGLIEVSRLGGMAEVAAEVLHNVGNVLNSVNVSASLLVDNVKGTRAARMAGVVALMREHRADLGAYLTDHSAGRHIPQLLEDLSAEWEAQQGLFAKELGELRGNVDLIKQIIASQQSRANAAEIVEPAGVDELVEEALTVQQGVLSQQHVSVVRDFTPLAPILVGRRKAVQILVSLLRNARQACKVLETDRRITIRISPAGNNAAISVSDNGAGIAAENLVRIFAPAFSTRPEAGGYGLHRAALAAAEMGGTLHVHSDGLGRGATFRLELPMQHAAVPA
jgi:PAS domain S-box-containing protein